MLSRVKFSDLPFYGFNFIVTQCSKKIAEILKGALHSYSLCRNMRLQSEFKPYLWQI